jgi:hypothetical protein
VTGPGEQRREPGWATPPQAREATLPDLPSVPLPSGPPARPTAVEAVGGVGHLDPWDEPEPARRDLYDRTAWIERMFWRNGFLVLFVLGVIAFAFQWLDWPYAAALALAGLVPGLFLMAREQIERNVEADRMAMRPETRHDGTLPPLRRTINRPLEIDE